MICKLTNPEPYLLYLAPSTSGTRRLKTTPVEPGAHQNDSNQPILNSSLPSFAFPSETPIMAAVQIFPCSLSPVVLTEPGSTPVTLRGCSDLLLRTCEYNTRCFLVHLLCPLLWPHLTDYHMEGNRTVHQSPVRSRNGTVSMAATV